MDAYEGDKATTAAAIVINPMRPQMLRRA